MYNIQYNIYIRINILFMRLFLPKVLYHNNNIEYICIQFGNYYWYDSFYQRYFIKYIYIKIKLFHNNDIFLFILESIVIIHLIISTRGIIS